MCINAGGNVKKMEILPNEVKEVKTVGNLHGDDVKMILTDGGFHLFMGKKNKKTKKPEVLLGSSHQAIGLHQLQQDFGADFHMTMTKSEHDPEPIVEDKTHYLSHNSINKGLKLFTVSKNNNLEFIVYKHGLVLGRYEASAQNKCLIIKKHEFTQDIKGDPTISNALRHSIEDKMYELKLVDVKKAE